MRHIFSATDGSKIPVIKDMNVQPLLLMGKPVTNGNGVPIMNDRWIYVREGRNKYAINVWRSRYCEKMQLAEISIQDSIGVKKLMDKDLKKFVQQVSNKLVFERHGKWYRVFLECKTSRTYAIKKVVPYNLTIDQNRKIEGLHAYNICIDWKQVFYVR